MGNATGAESVVQVTVSNIGGISDSSVELKPGVNVLSGRNATNRTSFLRALMAALGSDEVSLKSDAKEGRVLLELGDDRFTRQLIRRDGEVITKGDPYLEDPELADLFAFLLASNDARQAVVTGNDLHEIIMRPVDTAAIEREIDNLLKERNRVERELEELDRLEDTLVELEEDRTTVASELDEIRHELDRARESLVNAEEGLDESLEAKQILEEHFAELGEVSSDLERSKHENQAQIEALDSLEEEREQLQARLDSLPETEATRLDELEGEIESRRDRKRELESEMSTLQRIIQFNEQNLKSSAEGLEAIPSSTDEQTGSPTDQLLLDRSQVTCWTCGQGVHRDEIEGMLNELKEVREHKLNQVRAVNATIDELGEEISALHSHRQNRTQVQERLFEVEQEIEGKASRIEALEDRIDELQSEVEAIQSSIDDLQTSKTRETIELHKRVNELEVERGRVLDEQRRLESEIDEIETTLEGRSELRAHREEITANLQASRTRIDQIEREAVAAFNHHMETVLDVLSYDNIERIWLERVESTENRKTDTSREFVLNIVREGSDGSVYEDSIEHLSESEREVVGLIFALAGYLTHEVYEIVPLMLLDSLEAIDSDRIDELIEYFEPFPGYLVVALLPADARAIEEPDNVIESL